ncbi:Branched-chain amino acid transport protein [Duganella sp. CF458]|uniref:AzlD domain-containing protein n=1 Tax=Duganella sp. CF458 TaxID=1884368 RepID=UPI0008F13C9F|nr:AzlD domain-containing protein [Duganella sp. CF458]SFF56985.1 Branched-chain amino acid transport protein [Duganella sp. CF458]
MSDLEVWLTIAALACATAVTRSSFWVIGEHVSIPTRVQEMLRYAPACALAAIIGPDLLLDPQGTVEFSFHNYKLLAGATAIAYYLVRRNMLETIVFGMACFTALRLLVG